MIRSALQIFLTKGYLTNDREIAERDIMNDLRYINKKGKN